jgi:hypothetical protein
MEYLRTLKISGVLMSTIAIYDLSPTGFDLFLGAENYLDELSGDDLTKINGGTGPFCASLIVTVISAASGAVVSGVVGYLGRKK